MSQPGVPGRDPSDYERPNFPYRCGRGADWADPCAAGPNPDGSCGSPDSPCTPRLTLRALRWRLTALAVLFCIAVIAASFDTRRGNTEPVSPLHPGPLSAQHANFAREEGCATCHRSHGETIGSWMAELSAPHDFTNKCLACHDLGGPADKPHNTPAFHEAGLPETSCVSCHTEHQGTHAAITTMRPEQCHVCHSVRFDSFAEGHPPFRHLGRPDRHAIRFDHARHLEKYLADPRRAGRSPHRCQDCHLPEPATGSFRLASFERACAECHAAPIRQNDLRLLRLPDPAMEEASIEDAPPAGLFLLGISPRETSAYRPEMERLIQETAQAGSEAILARLAKKVPKETAERMVSGLDEGMLRRTAAQWVAGATEAPPEAPRGGWHWYDDVELELRYRPAGHADPVVRAWIEAAAGLPQGPEGPGQCMQCHAGATAGDWHGSPPARRAHTRFSHQPHLHLLACSECHVLDGKGTGAQAADFRLIRKEICAQCHAPERVRQDCFLCHQYHAAPKLVRRAETGSR